MQAIPVCEKMISSATMIFRNPFSKLIQVWKIYKITDWICMLAADAIFVLGYFLGTMFWRKGSSTGIVVLNFIYGTIGCVYFFYKGMKILLDTCEELISMCFEDFALTKEHVGNDYTIKETSFKRAQLRNSNEICFDSTGNQIATSATNLYESVLPLHADDYKQMNGRIKEKLSNADLYEQDFISERCEKCSLSEFVDDVVENKIDFNNDIDDDLCNNALYRLPTFSKNPQRDFNLSLTTLSSFAESPYEKWSPIGNSYLDEFKNPTTNYCIDHEDSYENLQTMKSFSKHLPKMPKIEKNSSLRRPLERFKSISEQNLIDSSDNKLSPYYQQCAVQSSASECFYPTVDNDFMQHYKRPRSQSFLFDSLRFECTTPPDPQRHLKPAKDARKPLPLEPQKNNFSVGNKTNRIFNTFPSPNQNLAKISENYLFHTPAQLNHKFCASSAHSPTFCNSQIPSPQQGLQFESRIPKTLRYLSPDVNFRRSAVLTRHRSNPIILGSISPPRTVQSPPPRSRPSPPIKINASLQNWKRSPPVIPRKMGSPSLTCSTFKCVR